jgi:L-ascorbate metabolism protein UlaG (beta-lactamase superfamily)
MPTIRRCRPWLLAALSLFLALGTARAAEEDEGCPALVASTAARVLPAAAARDAVRLTFVGHATFLIESPGGVTVATDYNDYVRPSVLPDVVTMNRAHSTHYTDHPDPRIKTVLRGWNPAGGLAYHDVTVGDVHIRNVLTNLRDFAGGTQFGANSIFVFETGELCIAHLGHLHHVLTPEHLKKLGRVDVVLVPVDGGLTLDLEGMLDNLEAIKPRLMIPMHYFNPRTLNRFLARAKEIWTVDYNPSPTVTLTRETLPPAPRMLVLPGR